MNQYCDEMMLDIKEDQRGEDGLYQAAVATRVTCVLFVRRTGPAGLHH